MGYLDYAGLQYLWGKLKEKFAPKSHTHDDRYYTEAEMDGKLSSKANSNHTHTKAQVGLGNVDNTADSAKSVKAATKLQTYKQGSTTETYGDSYPLYAQWYGNDVVLKCDNYKVKVNYAENTGTADSANSVAWANVKNKPTAFPVEAHTHDNRYYTEAEVDGMLNSKVNNNEAGADSLLSKLTTSWTATPTDNTYFIRQDTGGGDSFGRVKFSTLWNYIKGKTDGVYQPKGSYAASSHSHTKDQVGLGNVDNTADKDKNVKYATSAGSVTNAQCLNNDDKYMKFHWSGQDGQPTWLWGGNDSGDMYVYNPANFVVHYANWANGANNGVYASGFKSSGGGYIRFCNGLQICWGCNRKDTTAAVFDVPFKGADYTLVLGGSESLNNAWYVSGRTTTGFTPKQNGIASFTNWIAIGKWN